jgi:hypothetical protein
MGIAQQLTPGYYTRSHTGAQGNADHIWRTLALSKMVFPQGETAGIVMHGHCTAEFFAEDGAQGNFLPEGNVLYLVDDSVLPVQYTGHPYAYAVNVMISVDLSYGLNDQVDHLRRIVLVIG